MITKLRSQDISGRANILLYYLWVVEKGQEKSEEFIFSSVAMATQSQLIILAPT